MEATTIEGIVQHGRRLGRELGFPTANIAVPEAVDVADGVYYTRVEAEGAEYDAVSNLGRNPSVGGTERRLETHLFGFGGSLYGLRIRVRLLHRIRGERTFATVEELRAQIARDRDRVMELIARGDGTFRPDNDSAMERKTIALVGLGVIGAKHLRGIGCSDAVELVAVCDIDPAQRAKAAGVPFYTDCIEMVRACRPQWVVVAVPPAVHPEVVLSLLAEGCDVLCEKPLALRCGDCTAMIDDAAARGRRCSVLFHWQYGNEARYLYDHAGELLRPGIRRIETRVCDDYCDDEGNILPDRRRLCGTWFDGGINVLSFYDPLIATADLRMTRKSAETDAAGYERWSRREFRCGEIEVAIEVDWRQHSAHKFSTIELADGRTLAIEHSRQQILLDGNLLFDGETQDRLLTHYANFYRAFDAGTFPGPATVLRLHRLLCDNQ